MLRSIEIVIKLLQVVSKLSTFAKLWSSNIDFVSSPAWVISFKYQQHGWLAAVVLNKVFITTMVWQSLMILRTPLGSFLAALDPFLALVVQNHSFYPLRENWDYAHWQTQSRFEIVSRLPEKFCGWAIYSWSCHPSTVRAFLKMVSLPVDRQARPGRLRGSLRARTG